MFEKEAEIDEGRKRIDIIAANTSHCGFFFDICMKYQLRAPKIIIECKNYSSDIENPELDQLAGRLGSPPSWEMHLFRRRTLPDRLYGFLQCCPVLCYFPSIPGKIPEPI